MVDTMPSKRWYALSRGRSVASSTGPRLTNCARDLHLPRNLTCSASLSLSSLLLVTVLLFDSLAKVLSSWPTSVSVSELASLRLIVRPAVLWCSFFFFWVSVCGSWVPAVVEVGSVVGGTEAEGFSTWLGGIEVEGVSF